MKRPAFQFYPADWRKDMALQSCSVAARGLWIDMLCIAHECEPYGHLTVNGKPMTAAQIGRHTGLTERECAKLVAELEEAGVVSRTDEGALYSRRMVRDEDLRNRRAEGGKGGAEHGAKGAEHGAKGGRPKKERGDSKPPLEPPPSSSSSSSPSGEETGNAVAAAPAAPPPVPPLKARDLEAEGVEPQAAADWLALRKAKRLPLTRTAWDDTKAEGQKLGLTPAQTVAKAVANNWAGFKAQWLQQGSARQPAPSADIFAGAE